MLIARSACSTTRSRRPIRGPSARDVLPGLMCADAAKWDDLVAPPGRQLDRMADRDDARLGSGRARLLAARQHALEKRLGLIETPTLLLWGERDAIPRRLRSGSRSGWQRRLRIETIAGAGHLPISTSPTPSFRRAGAFVSHPPQAWGGVLVIADGGSPTLPLRRQCDFSELRSKAHIPLQLPLGRRT